MIRIHNYIIRETDKMKAKGIILALTILTGVLAMTACSDQTQQVNRAEKKFDRMADESVSEEVSDEQEQTASAEAEDTSDKTALQKAREEAKNEAEANGSDENAEETPSSDSDTQSAAEELYNKSCETFWNTLIVCGYQLDENDQSGEGVRVVDFDSLDALKEKYTEVFAEPDPTIDQKYFEENGKLYCRDGARGANIFYRSTELIPVKVTDFMAEYTAVSYYSDPDTNEPMDKKSDSFKMIDLGDGWRTAEFTLPY